MNKEICFYKTIWKKELFSGVMVVIMGATILMKNSSNTTSLLGCLLFITLGLCVVYDVIRDRLKHRPYLIITDDSIIIW